MTQPQPDGYLAVPPTGSGEPVLVLHAWWGLNDTIKAFCTGWPNPVSWPSPRTSIMARSQTPLPVRKPLRNALDANHLQAKAEIAEAALFLNERVGPADRGLAVIGFSLGAYYALRLCRRRSRTHPFRRPLLRDRGPAATSATQEQPTSVTLPRTMSLSRSPTSTSLEESLRSAGRPVTFYRYSGTGHWFFEPDRPQAYNQAAASLAWDRTLAFLRQASIT